MIKMIRRRKKKKKKKKKKKDEPEEPLVVLPKEIMPPQSITVFYASNTTQLAYEHPDYKNGLFYLLFIKGFEGRG